MKIISLFSGAGGLDLGLEKAGFDTRLCVEIDEDARATIRLNRPHWNATEKHGGDLTRFSVAEILAESGLEREEVDMVCGGPPCQSFSNLGRKGGLTDERGSLVLQYLRIIKGIRPKYCLFENVEGLLQHSQAVNALQRKFETLGYCFELFLVNAADYGVPQIRKRIIGLGARAEHEVRFPMPTHADAGRTTGRREPWVTVGEALSRLPDNYESREDNFKMQHAKYMIRRMARIKPGENFKSLPQSERPPCWKEGKHQGADTFGRLHADRPSVTIRTSGFNPTKGRYIHPFEDRGLSTIEMACLQTFPFEWRFVGCMGSVGRQIGNAVPPLLAYHIGAALSGKRPSQKVLRQLGLFAA